MCVVKCYYYIGIARQRKFEQLVLIASGKELYFSESFIPMYEKVTKILIFRRCNVLYVECHRILKVTGEGLAGNLLLKLPFHPIVTKQTIGNKDV